MAVRGRRIAGVGDLSAERAGTDIDARGLALAPGFVDVHSHDDFAVFQAPRMDFKVCQGVTTDVVGNCGFGAAPMRVSQRAMALFGSEELRDMLPDCDGYGEYLDAVDAEPPSLNVAVLVGHGTIRFDAVEDDPGRRSPSSAELKQMVDALGDALAAGCVGYSTGLIYEPGRYSTTDELVALARVTAAEGGLYATHMRNESARLLEAVTEAVAIGEATDVPVQISHHKASGRAAWGLVRESLALIDEARARGADVTADQYPYTASSTSLAAVLQNHEDANAGLGTTDWSAVVVASAPDHRHWEGASVAQLAQAMEVEAEEAARTVVEAEGYAAAVVIHSMSEDDVRTVMAHPTTMIGSDGLPTPGGRPHPRLYGTFARVLGRYVRDERVLSLEEAVHRMTGMPAAKFGLPGRGRIEAGAWADLVLFDPATIDDVATYESPRQHPIGIRGVWVNGTRVVRDGVHTGERPGRAVRRGRAG
ncbi:MAG TPA: D-aminoacylase [Acidimicrobiales bacterium]|nr:D-aminoacylase [Acidimicrobiales bacterium]